ncbi:hypothetical protein OBJ99_02375 [Empedobacter falsenii]
MKLKLKNYILGVLGLVTLQQADAQVIFKDDFGKSEIRLPSQFVPETGRDSSLEGVFTHQSKFYKYAAIAPNYDGENVNQNTINNGYYAIVAPKFIYNNLPTGKPNWANWWTPIQNNTDQSDNGAVLVVNGDEVLNQYYRRAVSLEKGKTYRISVYLYGVGKNNVGVKFEAQNILSEKVLDESSDFLLSEANKWEQKSWTFKIPENDNCSNIAISLRNTIKTNDGNDFYVDDIVLEEYYDPTAPVIPCANEQVNFDDIIKATNDRFTFNSRGGKFDVLSNDALNKGNDQFILSGDKKNATIGKIGIWPEGFSFDSNGQLVIAPNAPNPGLPLVYQVCNLLGVCTTAKIVLEKDMGIPFAGNDDPFYWGNTTYNVIANDIYNDYKAGEGFIFSGSDQNMTISVKDNWPSGITMDANGVITIAPNTPKPTTAIFYTLCNMTGFCQDVQVTFLGDEGPFNPGKISTIGETCYNGEIEVVNVEKATYIAYLMSYNWQASVDNGATWQDFGSLTDKENEKDQSVGDVIIQKGDKLVIKGLKKTTLVRRQAKTIGLNRYAYTSPVLVTPSEENTIALLPDKVNAFAVEQGKEFTFPTVSTKFPSTITIYDSEGKEVGTTISDLKKGEYTYTIQATTTTDAPVEGCVTSVTIQLIVYDLKDCDIVKKKIFATDVRDWTSGASGVEGEEKAVNGNRADYATITGGVVILGIGTVGVDLYFTKLSDPNDPKSKRVLYTAEELKGKKVTIKLGEQYSGLKLAGGLTVVGRHTTATNPSDIGIGIGNSNVGTSFGVKGGVLDLLKGDNVFQFSFIPAKTNGEHVGYNGVRIQLGSLLAGGDMATVFYAYIEEEEEITSPDYKPLGDIIVNPPKSLVYPTEQNDVDGTKLTGIKNTDIKLNEFTNDVTWGNRSEVLNVASGLSSVVHPYYAVDDNYDSYTLFNATAGVLNQQFLRTHLRQPARPGDQVQITLAYPNINVLNLSLLQLGNFKIVYYLGDTKVGEENMEKFRVLDIGLFNFKNKRRAVISKPITIPFDSFEIQQFSTVSVNLGDGMHVHDIRIAPMMLFEGQEDPKEVTKICAADFLAIQSPDFCTEYEISIAKVVEFGNPYTIPDKDEDPNNNLPLLDKDGKPIKEILKIEDIPNSQLAYSHTGAKVMYYSIDRLYTEYEEEGIILVKVQTKRQGQNYGNPQYLRVKLENCNEALVNPVIRLSN